MAIKYRAAEQSIGLTNVPSDDPNLPPDIFAPGESAVPTALVTDPPIPATTSSTSSSSGTTSSQSSAATSAAPTQSGAASKGGHGLSHGDIAAIVIPIALLAILIPILVLWYFDRKHRAAAEKRSSHRSSNEAMLKKHPSVQEPPQPKGPKPARPERTPLRSVVDPSTPELRTPGTRNSLGLFNFELSPPSTPGMGWMTPNPRFSIARALQMRRSQPSIVLSQPRTSQGDANRPPTGVSERSERRRTGTSVIEPPPPYVIDGASPKDKPASHFAPLEQIGTLQHPDRPYNPTMQPAMAPTLPPIDTTDGALNVQQPRFTPRHTPRPSSEILQLPDAYGRVHTRSPSPTASMHNGSTLSRPFSYTAPERISDISAISDEPEPWRRMRESHGSSVISPIESDESSTIHPHQVL